jgi:hypothetical protein
MRSETLPCGPHRRGDDRLGGAGDDVAIRAAALLKVTGAVTSGDVTGADAAGAADRLIAEAGAMRVGTTDFALAGGDVDIRSASIDLDGGVSALGAGSDVRLQATAALETAAVNAGRDVLIDGSTTTAANVATGALTAARDVGVRSTSGSITVASASSGDDAVLRARDAATVTGTLTSTGLRTDADASSAGDLLSSANPTVLDGALALTDGSHVDIKTATGAIAIGGATTAATDARLQAGGTATTAGVAAGRDILLDGATVTTGELRAARDVAVRGRTGGVTIASATAGDDVVVRATAGLVKVTGALTSGNIATADGPGVADRLIVGSESGPTTLGATNFTLAGGSDVDIRSASIDLDGGVSALGAGADVRLQATGGVATAAVNAGQDILIDGATATAASVNTGALTAARDVGVRATTRDTTVGVTTGSIMVASASAGGDVLLRAAGSITANGALNSGATSGADGVGVVDQLIDLQTVQTDRRACGSGERRRDHGGRDDRRRWRRDAGRRREFRRQHSRPGDGPHVQRDDGWPRGRAEPHPRRRFGRRRQQCPLQPQQCGVWADQIARVERLRRRGRGDHRRSDVRDCGNQHAPCLHLRRRHRGGACHRRH